VLGWRDTPTFASAIGRVARASQPYIQQIFVGRPPGLDERCFRAQVVYRAQTRRERNPGSRRRGRGTRFTFPRFSCRTVVYKGLVLASQLTNFYRELSDPDVVSALCLVHQRFFDKHFSQLAAAHPYRYIAHNGEINTLRGNVNWMHGAANRCWHRHCLVDDLKKTLSHRGAGGEPTPPASTMHWSFLLQAGRSLPHAMAMLIPEAWAGNPHMKPEKRAFYEYHAA